VTRIAAAVKTPGRYNIFVDGKYACSLDELQLVESGLKRGDELSEERLAELRDDSAFGKHYVRALDLISRRRRSEQEIRDYARRKEWTPENTERVVTRLAARGYLDDAEFARRWVEGRHAVRGVSRRKLVMELRQKGIAEELVEAALAESERSDRTEMEKVIAKKRRQYDDEQLIAYLTRQGFDRSLARELVTQQTQDF
jgi:regulatory protein